MPSPPVTRVRPIRTLHAAEIQGDVARFYDFYAQEPLIIRGVFAPGHPLHDLDLGRLEEILSDARIRVYGSSYGYVETPAAELFADVRSGTPRYNVVDHSIVGTPLGALFEAPPFLRCNWFLGPPARLDSQEKSVVLSPQGSFTPLHLDAYGMQGWMYLITGRKTWELYPPRHLLALFDPIFKEFFDPRKHAPERFPLLVFTEKHVGAVAGGDLLFFPAGWIHQVETTEASFGVGGSLINEFQIEEHMRWWLWERTLHLEGPLDLKQVLLDMPEDRFLRPPGRASAEAALILCREWEARMKEIESAT